MFLSRFFRFVISAIILVAFSFGITHVYRISTSQKIGSTLSGDEVLKRAGKHILLPTSTPSVAFITDINLLKQRSSYFTNAKNGDAVIIFPEKVIVYNPAKDKVIDIYKRDAKK